MPAAAEIDAEWVSRLVSTEPADRPGAESALRNVYTAAGMAPPQHFFWFDSPFPAAWAVALLTQPHDVLWQRIFQALERRKVEREYTNRVRAMLCHSAAQSEWKSVVELAGEPLLISARPPSGAQGAPPKSIHLSISLARFQLYEKFGMPFKGFDPTSIVASVELPMRAVVSGQESWSVINPLLTASFYQIYSFAMMATDHAAIGDLQPPPILAAAWEVARSAGLWWPFTRSVLLSDRPAEIHLDEKSLLHRGDGPAAVYRDGARIWAWNGRAMRESWIMHPEDMPARDVRAFGPAFREYAAAHAARHPPKLKLKPSAILKKTPPVEAEARVALLRAHNQDRLPFFERYLAGEHEKVWAELVALGPSVREDPNAADALAVAYETMRRVNANVREVTSRLRDLGYRFASKHPHDPPGRSAAKQVARLEKLVGGIPLSLRAFYEVVGEVDWIGEHPAIAAPHISVAPDPLVIFPVEDALAQCAETFEDGEGVIFMAPDDLHKAHTSGGEPYEIAVPDLAADGRFMNERHELYFVDYLRLVFRFGGFPGYEGADRDMPSELAGLSAGLLQF